MNNSIRREHDSSKIGCASLALLAFVILAILASSCTEKAPEPIEKDSWIINGDNLNGTYLLDKRYEVPKYHHNEGHAIIPVSVEGCIQLVITERGYPVGIIHYEACAAHGHTRLNIDKAMQDSMELTTAQLHILMNLANKERQKELDKVDNALQRANRTPRHIKISGTTYHKSAH